MQTDAVEGRKDAFEVSKRAIEVTPDMIEAGCNALSRFFVFELDQPEVIVTYVFLEMIAARETMAVPYG